MPLLVPYEQALQITRDVEKIVNQFDWGSLMQDSIADSEPDEEPMEMDKEIYENGKTVFVSHSIPSKKFEKWVKSVAKECGLRVDWFCMGGRDVVRTLGDVETVRRTIVKLFPEHERLYEAEWPQYYDPENGSGACFYIDDCLIPVRLFMPADYVAEQWRRAREKNAQRG
jgi:hypothetical protein